MYCTCPCVVLHISSLCRPGPVFTFPAWGWAEPNSQVISDIYDLSWSWSGMKWLWAARIVWTHPVRFISLSAFPWRHGERARKTADSDIRMEYKQTKDLTSKICVFISQRNVMHLIWVKLYRQHINYHRTEMRLLKGFLLFRNSV